MNSCCCHDLYFHAFFFFKHQRATVLSSSLRLNLKPQRSLNPSRKPSVDVRRTWTSPMAILRVPPHIRCPESRSTPETRTHGCSSKWQPTMNRLGSSPLSCSRISSPRLLRTSGFSVPGREVLDLRTPSSTGWYQTSCVRWGFTFDTLFFFNEHRPEFSSDRTITVSHPVRLPRRAATSPKAMVQEVNPSMATSLKTRTSTSGTRARGFFPWPITDGTPTAHSSSSP